MVSAVIIRTSSEANTIKAMAQLGMATSAEELVIVDPDKSATAFAPFVCKPQTIPPVPDGKALLRETAPPFNQQLEGGVHAK